MRLILRRMLTLWSLPGLLVLSGCATPDQRVSLLYRPLPVVTGGTGDLYVADRRGKKECCQSDKVLWVVGRVRDAERAQILSRVPTDDLLLQAYQDELAAAGYRVVRVSTLPEGVGKGMDFNKVTVELEQLPGVLKSEAKVDVSVELELWKNGQALKKLRYQYSLSDAAFSDRDQLVNRVLEQAFRQMMKQSLPEIVQGLEQGS